MKRAMPRPVRAHRDPLGCAPEKAPTVLLLIDVINGFDFPEAKRLLKFALPAARRIAALKKRLTRKGVPAIYVNDNFGRWRSDFKAQVEQCVDEKSRGSEIARMLIPREDDYFILKPKHSAFYSTSLDVLLHYLGAATLILTGFAGDICVLYTANDAYMRDFQLVVPGDCIASESAQANHQACVQMRRFLKADTRASRFVMR